MSVKVHGLKETRERFVKLGNTERLNKALDEAAALVEREAADRIPVDSGQSQAQIYVRSDGKLSRFVGSDTKQALFAEYSPLMLQGGTVSRPREGPWPYERGGITRGTKATATMPWLRPSLQTQKREIFKLIRDALKED